MKKIVCRKIKDRRSDEMKSERLQDILCKINMHNWIYDQTLEMVVCYNCDKVKS